MKFPLRILPFILFFIFYALIQVSFRSLRTLQEKEDRKQTKVLQEIVVNRFQQYLELPLMIANLGAQFVGSGDIMKAPYESYIGPIRISNPEFLGFNIINPEGVIVRTSPGGENAKALGKLTQNYKILMSSFLSGDPYHFSSPFRLHQEQQGFVLYVPMLNAGKLKGWYALVISSSAFLKTFRLEDFLKLYDLVILDDTSGQDYFSTAISPPEGAKVYSSKASIFGRKMTFKTWRKEEAQTYAFPWYFSVIFSLILSLASAFILRLHGQRKRARDQLRNMSILLRITSKEALSNLIDIHSDFNRLNLPEDEKTERVSRDIQYLTNLIEQIDLLQTMAQSREVITNSENEVSRLIQNQLENFAEVMDRKNIKVIYRPEDFAKVVLRTNTWLFENSILSNVFSHLLIFIEPGSTLNIEHDLRGPWQIIIFRIKRMPGSEPSRVITRRLEVARKVLELHEGSLKEEKEDDQLVIRLLIPR